jgi:hypothetical protein
MTELSPSAQAVFDAYLNAPCGKSRQSWVAAALRASADQVVIKLAGLGQESAWCLEEIATELEAQ